MPRTADGGLLPISGRSDGTGGVGGGVSVPRTADGGLLPGKSATVKTKTVAVSVPRTADGGLLLEWLGPTGLLRLDGDTIRFSAANG